MFEKTKILFGDNESNWGNLCAGMLDSSQYESIVTEKEALLILEQLYTVQPDILILETSMNTISWMGFMALVQYIPNYKPTFVIIQSEPNPQLKQMILEQGAAFCLVKPFGFDELCSCIECLVEERQKALYNHFYSQTSSLENTVSMALLELKISANLKGYQYLRHGIILALKDFSIMESATKRLYPTIANAFNTNMLSVERAIRNAISTSWGKLDATSIEKYLGGLNEKPTNARYIATIAEYLRLHHQEFYKQTV